MAAPPPPPPPPGMRGGPPQPFRPMGGGGAPPPPPGIRPGPGPGPQGMPMQMPIRQFNSMRVSDITPKKSMDEDACKKRLTTYEAYTIRKCPPKDPKKDRGTWAKAEVAKEPLSQDDIAKEVKKLNEGRKTVAEKKQSLAPFQQGQITRLLDELMTGEHDHNFEWSLAQLDRTERPIKNNMRETTTLTVFVKRCPIKDVNPVVIFQTLERIKADRMQQMSRPPQPMPLPAGAIPIGPGGKKMKGKKHPDDSSDTSEFDSDTASDSDLSSSNVTSISSRSGRRQRRYSHKGRIRSHSRHREHHKQYYISDRVYSPEPLYRDALRYTPAPEVPRSANYDTVAAAYQAGKNDADAERFGLSDRYIPRGSVALVSYGRDRRASEPRYYDERYVDDYRPRDEEYLRREEVRRREAEDYMDRRPSEPRVFSNPFYSPSLPRRYPPSHSSGW